MAVTPQRIVNLTNAVILNLAKRRYEFKGEAINWADLSCVEAIPYAAGDWHVLIEEASPDSHVFCKAIAAKLSEHGIEAYVQTQW